MELARKRGIPVHEKILVRHDLYIADEVFATGTAAEVIPITEIERRPVGDGKPGTITKQLIKDFVAYRNREYAPGDRAFRGTGLWYGVAAEVIASGRDVVV
jgi:branched-chain amino acid aminotransferase